ncbi:MAG: nitroreductase family protein [Spirochaetales bacterium]|jgi:nitroreductase|nr:nitroreductase family protein [Spirochaetales bacterium]
MRKIAVGILILSAAALVFFACKSEKTGVMEASANAAAVNSKALNVITGNYAASPGKFQTGKITEDELNTILQAGVRSPSARNGQPWHFTVVRDDAALAKAIISNITEGNIIIVVSGEGDGKTNSGVILDCGLATENIYLAAQALGLGSRIYTGPIDTINAKHKESLDLPRGYSAVALVRVGRLEQADALSAASSRKDAAGMIGYK